MSSGRYQSRLFNLVHQQSRRLTTQWESTFRHLQVATKWGVELILYPVYLFLQSADTTVKKLSSPAPSSHPKLSPNYQDFPSENPPSADTAIDNILQAVEHLPDAETTVISRNISKLWQPVQLFWSKFFDHPTNNSHFSQPLTIPHKTAQSITPTSQNDVFKHQLSGVRGIATSLINRQLVLVNLENETLDILTPEQQAKISQIITNELADHQHELQLPQTNSKPQILTKFQRILTKLTGKYTVKLPLLTDSIPKIITSIDTVFAHLEAKAIVPSQEIIRVTQTHINIFVYGKEQLVNRGDIAVSADDLASEKFNISALIEASINYFFGIGKSKNLNARGAKDKALSQSSDEPWLNWNDLYGETPTLPGETTQPLLKINPGIVPNPSAGLSWQQKMGIPPSKGNSSLVPRKKQSQQLTRFHKTSAKITTIQPIKTAISPFTKDSEIGEISPQQLHQSEDQPDWIDTQATPVGYEKHLLEQVLELLDRAMVWLEQRVVKIFQKLQSLWRGK